PSLFKVAGQPAGDVWIVGDRGVISSGDAERGFELLESGSSAPLFTVHCSRDEALIVGGEQQAAAVLDTTGGSLRPRAPQGMGLLQGAFDTDEGDAWVTGRGGTIYQRIGVDGGFVQVDPGFEV